MIRSFPYKRRGVAVLPVMILIGAIIIEIAIVGGILAFFNSTSNLSVKASQEALFTARSGAEDALLKIVRDKDYTPSSTNPYSFYIGFGNATNTASVWISSSGSSQRTIVATSTVSRRIKTVQVVLNIDSSSGKVDVLSFGEVTN